jgi:hypothetical protein
MEIDVDDALPLSYKQAMAAPESHKWREAIAAEVDSLTGNQTFVYVPESQAKGCKILTTRWLFTKKPAADERDVRFKARLVARGDKQRPGIDFSEVYSPVACATTVRALLSVAAVKDYELDQLDAVTAFLNAPLSDEEHLFLRVPDGFDARPGCVLKLTKSLYGLKQAPRHWNKMLDAFLREYGMQQSKVDPCLYFIPGKIWIVVWVDDFLVMGVDKGVTAAFKNAIANKFRMRDLGCVKEFLGMQVVRDRHAKTISISSSRHIDMMLERFAMKHAKPFAIPLQAKTVLVACTDKQQLLPAHFPYRAVVGSLLYIATWTRPDIAFAVSQVARFQVSPGYVHWTAAKQILRYLKATKDLQLCYSANRACTLGTFRVESDKLRRRPLKLQRLLPWRGA